MLDTKWSSKIGVQNGVKIWSSKLKGFKNGIECRKKDKSLSRTFVNHLVR